MFKYTFSANIYYPTFESFQNSPKAKLETPKQYHNFEDRQLQVFCQQLHNSLRGFDFGIGKYRYLILDMLSIYPPQRSSRVDALVKPLPPFLGLEPENVIVRRLITQLVLNDCYCPPPTLIQYRTVLTRTARIRKVQKSSSYMFGGN